MPRLPVALACLLAVVGPAGARQSPDAPAHDVELAYCRAHVAQLTPPGAQVPDGDAFCACFAREAVTARLWELGNAEANLGEEVRRPVAERIIALRDEKAAKVAADCATR